MQEFGANIHSISSKKKWYFFLGTHHIGPFDEDQVINLYRQNKIGADTMTFCQGMNEWRPIRTLTQWREILVFDIEENERPLKKELRQDLIPTSDPLIEAPSLENIASIPPAPRPPSSYFGAQELAREWKPVKKAIPPKTPHKTPIEIEDIPPLPPVIKKAETEIKVQEKKSSGAFKKIVLSFFLTLLFLIPALFLFSGEDQFEEENRKALDQLSSGLKSRLLLVSREDHLPFFKIALAQGANSNPKDAQILLAINKMGPYELQATLTSVAKKIKSREMVVLKSKGISGHHFALLKNWTITEGTAFLPGLYALDLSLRPTGIKNNFLLWLKKSAYFNFIPMVSEIEEVSNYRGLFWPGVGAGPNEEKKFEEELRKYFVQELDNKTKPFQEKLEYWRTLHSLMEELRAVYSSALKEMKSGKDFRLYEKNYAKKVAMPLQHFVQSFDLKKIEEGKDQQILMAKEIGKLAADMSILIQKKGKITPSIRAELRNVFDENWVVLFNATQTAISHLEKEILKIQQEFAAE